MTDKELFISEPMFTAAGLLQLDKILTTTEACNIEGADAHMSVSVPSEA